MILLKADYSPHIRANVRLYEADGFIVGWHHTDGTHGTKIFVDRNDALSYFNSLFPGGKYEQQRSQTAADLHMGNP